MTFPGLTKANNLSDVADKEKAWDNLGNDIRIDPLSWTPALINTALWLDAADASTVTVSGGTVSQWNDKSGNARHATQSTVGNRPTYTSAALNGKNVLTFDGTNDTLIGAFMPSLSDFSVFAVVTGDLIGGNQERGIFAIDDATRNGYITGYWLERSSYGDGGLSVYLKEQSNSISGLDRSAFSAKTLCHQRRINVSSRLFIDGIQQNTYTTGNVVTQTTNSFRYYIGRTDLSYAGTIAEIIVVTTADESIRQRIESYLAFKWNLASNLSTITVTGRDIFALNQVRNVSVRDFVFIKNLSAPVQARLTGVAQNTASGVTLSNTLLLKQSPSSAGNYLVASGTLNASQLKINGILFASLSSSPFSGSTALFPLTFSTMELSSNFRLVPLFASGTIASPTIAIPVETSELYLYAKAGQN